MQKFYIAFNKQLVILEKNKISYKISEHLQEKSPNRLAFFEKEVYCGTNKNGLWKSEDEGDSWEKVDLDFARVASVAVNPTTGEIYAGTEPSHVLGSKDGGENWRDFEGIQNLPSKENWRFPPRPETHYVRWLTPSFSNEKHLAVSIEAGAVINSYDGGETWVDRVENSPIDVHTLLAHPKAPGRLYAANGDGASDPKKAYAESFDEGRTWEYMSDGLGETRYLYNLAINPDDPNDRLVSASKNASGAHRSPRYSTIYRKIGAEPWIEIADGLPRTDAYTHHLAPDPKIAGAFYAFNNFGLYHLDAGAKKWKRVDIPELEPYLGKRAYHFVVK